MRFERQPNDPDKKELNPLLRLALELGPLMVFFFVNARGEDLMAAYPAFAYFGSALFLATGLFMIAVTISLVLSWFLTGALAIMPLVSGVVVLAFGGLTLYLQSDIFIKMKPTIVNTLFGGILLVGLAFGRSFLGLVFRDAIALDDEGWKKLTLRWGLFFLFLAIANEVVWRTQSTDFWVAFKVWGIMPITFVFTLAQIPLMQRHMVENYTVKSE
jgi:intracellular septation protein